MVYLDTRKLTTLTASKTGRFADNYTLSTYARGAQSIWAVDSTLDVDIKANFTAHK